MVTELYKLRLGILIFLGFGKILLAILMRLIWCNCGKGEFKMATGQRKSNFLLVRYLAGDR